ncbi:unnamed protein product [Paramecium sonneborni]|uniref:Adenosine kinase n=1 Tax=Paramecium sonneborni TaxID=65129 RepID=A0A8S1R919_9CILI|nr:unnamed protein product [Paramecium sonneborni]
MQNKIKKIIVKDGVTALFDEQQYPTGKCAVLLCNKDRFHTKLNQIFCFFNRSICTFNFIQELNQQNMFLKLHKKVKQTLAFLCLLQMQLMIDLNKFYPFYLMLIIYLEMNKKQENLEKHRLQRWFRINNEKDSSIQQNWCQRQSCCLHIRSQTYFNSFKNDFLNVNVETVDSSKIEDTNSAGDSYCLRFIAQLLNGPDLIKCVKDGNYSAAQTIQHEGSTIPNYQSDFKF